mmetsp:Transcript_21237/g.38752  ORF Transcript_21237/g.38752 Transcript_21237/m.38752 type:complete len:175 (+) Transcript_21237:110-634(+)
MATGNVHAEVLRIQAECRRTAEMVSTMSEEFGHDRQARKSWGSVSTTGPTTSITNSSVPSTTGADSLDTLASGNTPTDVRAEVRRRRDEAQQRKAASRQRMIEVADLRAEAEARAAEAKSRREERLACAGVVDAGPAAGDDKKPSGCSDGTTATSSTSASSQQGKRKARVVVSL